MSRFLRALVFAGVTAIACAPEFTAEGTKCDAANACPSPFVCRGGTCTMGGASGGAGGGSSGGVSGGGTSGGTSGGGTSGGVSGGGSSGGASAGGTSGGFSGGGTGGGSSGGMSGGGSSGGASGGGSSGGVSGGGSSGGVSGGGSSGGMSGGGSSGGVSGGGSSGGASGGGSSGGGSSGGVSGGGTSGGGSSGGVSGGGTSGGGTAGGSGGGACPGGLVTFQGLSRITIGAFGGPARGQLAFANGDGGLGILSHVCAGSSFTSTSTASPVRSLHALRHNGGQPVDLVALFDDEPLNTIQYRGSAAPDGGFVFQRLNPSIVSARPTVGLVVDYRGSGVEDFIVASDSPANTLVPYLEGAPSIPGLGLDSTVPLSFQPTSLAALRGATWSWVWVGGPSLMGLTVVALPRLPSGGSQTQYTGSTTTASLSHLASVQAWSTILGVTYGGGALLSFRMNLNDVDGGSAVTLTTQVPGPSGPVALAATRAMVVGDFRYRVSDPVPSLVTASFSGAVTIAPLTFDGGVSAALLLSPPSLPAAANDVALGDLDGDGAIDLAIALDGPPGLAVIWGR